MADVTAPKLREYPVPPAIQPDAMAGSMPYVATEKMQEAIGFPAKLVDDWHDKAIAKIDSSEPSSLNNALRAFAASVLAKRNELSAKILGRAA